MNTLTAEERRFLFAVAHAQRLYAAACAANADAERLNPWVPEDYRQRCAQSRLDQAARHMDRAHEVETEATEQADAA